MRSSTLGSAFLLLAVSHLAAGQDRFIKHLRLACDSTAFGPSIDLAALTRRFGTENVVARDSIYVGEGFYEQVSVVFRGTRAQRVDIAWRDTVAHRNPAWIHIAGDSTQWTTDEGITIGTRLRTLERINGKPFRVAGFGFDGSGFIERGWSGGSLSQWGKPACSLSARLRPIEFDDADHRWANQVSDGRFFSSGHLAMQALDPRISEIWLEFKPATPNRK